MNFAQVCLCCGIIITRGCFFGSPRSGGKNRYGFTGAAFHACKPRVRRQHFTPANRRSEGSGSILQAARPKWFQMIFLQVCVDVEDASGALIECDHDQGISRYFGI